MKRLYEAHNLAPVRPPRGLASYYLEKEVQVVVVGLDLDIGMKLSMSRIPYEGAPTVCQAAPLLITGPRTPNLPRFTFFCQFFGEKILSASKVQKI